MNGTYTVPVRHARLERKHALEVLNLLLRQRHIEGFAVRLELVDLAPANDGEHVRRLLHHVRDRDCLNILCTDLGRDLLEGLADLALVFGPLPGGGERHATCVHG